MIRLLVVVALAGLAVALVPGSASPEGARAQVGGGVYEGTTDDGRVFRFVVSEDGSQIEVVHLTDVGGLTCASGHVDRFIASTTAPIAGGHFDLNLVLHEHGRRSEPTSQATEVTISGGFQADGSLTGTFRGVRAEDPVCDSGALAWSGEFLFSEKSVRQATRHFSGRTEEGGNVRLSLSPALDFVRELSIAVLHFGAPDCKRALSNAVSLIPGAGVLSEALAEPVASGEFDFVRTLIVAETSPSNTVFVTGSLLSDTEAAGTIRVRSVEQPECDTGVLSWTATAPPPATPTPGELPAGGSGPAGGGEGTPLVMVVGVAASLIGLGAAGRALLRRR